MVAGHLTLKNGRYYAVLNYRNAGGQRKTKWISLGLPEKGNKRKAEAELARIRAEFEPPKEVGDPSSDMLFADYLLEWLEIAKGRLAVATYSSYAAMINKPIGPYFRQRNLTLRELEARHLQMFYSEMLRKVKPNTVIHYHAIIHSALKYAVKTDMLVQNVADKVDRPKKNSFQPVFLSAEEMQKMFEALRGTKLELPVLVAAFYGFRRGDDDDKIRLNQRKPSKYKGLSRFGPEKNLQRINKFMKERPTFYKKLIQMKENFRFYLRCFYCITKVVILQFNSEKQDRISS